ncbi:T9SS type A sorting domain-containing protein [Edaphocola aurantiacus]|uniref:T9SS type A sorting domain-containing protein n=1 Tax=Edaphocola aurantiacus TaxID=2601682 RepID=UPI001C938EC9|nr:T9SS type A sorting domain-containing protein [Edaphocola aurantiacus]
MKLNFTRLIIVLLTMLSGTAGKLYAQIITVNCTVNAGGNSIICGSSTTLTGGVSGTVGAGNPTWSFVSGPTTPVITTPNSLTTTVTGMTVNGDYVFSLSHPCGTGTATSNVTITAHPRPAGFTAGSDITTICATTGTTNLSGVIPAGYTGSWRAVNIFNLARFNTQVSTNAQFSSTTTATPTFSLINTATHEIDPAYYAILRITSLDGICSYEDTTIVRFVPNPQIVSPTTVSKCRNPSNSLDFYDFQSTSPAFSTAYAGSAGTVANGNTVTLNVISQPAGANMTFYAVELRRVYFTGMTINGTYQFTLTVTNSCGTYTTPTISFTYTGTTPSDVNFAPAAHPEQYKAYATSGSGGEVHCTNKVGSTTPELFYFDINPSDPATVTNTITPSGFFPPGGAPTVSLAGAGTYNRTVTVTPPAGGWQIGTYKFSVSTSNGSCSISQPYYIHISDNNRPDVAVSDQSICYPGTGAISATIPLPAIYKGVVNSSYFQEFNGIYSFSVISKPAGSATPTYTSSNLRSITSTSTLISNLDKAGDYVFRIETEPATAGIGPFLDQEYACSGAAMTGTFTVHVENPVNANAGSDQSGLCANSAALLGNNPGSGTGAWTVAQAPTGAVPVIASTSSFSTVANNMDSVGTYRFVWTISSPMGGCVSRDTVAYQVTCPLPVQLLRFEAIKQPNSVLLEWLTAAEQNSWGFDIERSTDSKDWNIIGSVRSNAAVSQGRYTYTDQQPVYGDNFYRLKQKDHDGAYAYSPVRIVKYSQNNGITLYPNPARESVTINGLKGTETVTVYNTNGQVVYTGNTKTGAVQVNMKHLPAGVYLCIVADQTGAQLSRSSFVKE